MCNYSKGVYNDGMERGRNTGIAAHISIPAITSASVRTIRCLQRLTAFFALKPSTAAASASAFIPRKSQAELFTERILDSSADSGGV